MVNISNTYARQDRAKRKKEKIIEQEKKKKNKVKIIEKEK